MPERIAGITLLTGAIRIRPLPPDLAVRLGAVQVDAAFVDIVPPEALRSRY